MSEKIFIARQDTLEEVKTAAADNGGRLAQVLALLGTGENGDENALSGAIIPAQLLNDYKLYGVDSFVYNTPALWETLLLHPYTANDRWANGDALEYVLTNPGKLALPAWLGMLSDTKAQASKFSGLTTAAKLAGNSAAMTALAASETTMYALTGSETMWAAVVASSTAMKAVAGSEIAMRIVCGDKTAMAAVVVSETAMTAVAASSTAMSLICADNALFTAITASETAMTALTADETAMAVIAESENAMKAVTLSQTAMDAVAASAVAIGKIVLNTAALDKLRRSAYATAAFHKSPLKKSLKSYSYGNAANTTDGTITIDTVIPKQCILLITPSSVIPDNPIINLSANAITIRHAKYAYAGVMALYLVVVELAIVVS